MYCEVSSSRFRSYRSATTPPTSVSSKIGSSPRNESRPRKNADDVPVIVSTSQFWATFCIQVPMVEVNAPNHRTRKSRYVSAAAMRRNPVGGGGSGREAGSTEGAWTGACPELCRRVLNKNPNDFTRLIRCAIFAIYSLHRRRTYDESRTGCCGIRSSRPQARSHVDDGAGPAGADGSVSAGADGCGGARRLSARRTATRTAVRTGRLALVGTTDAITADDGCGRFAR